MSYDGRLFYCQQCQMKSESVCPEHGPAAVLVAITSFDSCDQDEDHDSCPGKLTPEPGQIALCACPCHVTADEWFRIMRWVLDEPVV